MTATIILPAIAAIAALALLALELKRDLMMLQQNSYRPERYMHWLRQSGDTTSWERLTTMVAVLLSLSRFASHRAGMIITGIVAIVIATCLATRKYKKPLVFTPRALRLYITAAVISLAIAAGATAFAGPTGAEGTLWTATITLAALYVLSHSVMLAACYALMPLEKAINRHYYNEASRILASMPGLTVVGVTGSYGKTSTKHYLQRILQEKYNVLMTPGSYNTTLGVVRTVRELMKPYYDVFIVEMGAKNPGDIKEICDLVHPTVGIVTAVGPQHLESFKTIERVQATKFELVDSLPSDGLAVINNDFELIASRPVDNVDVERYGVRTSDGTDFHAVDIAYSATGTTFTIFGKDKEPLELSTSLLGECNVSNLIAAAIVARHLGVDDDLIRYAVANIAQVEHRLSIKHAPNGITILDDAFNSNPSGSAMALDVLSHFTTGTRYVITPGMIELGERQTELNREFGARIAMTADVAIVVGRYNRDAIVDGINSAERRIEVIEADTFAQAQALLTARARKGDTVLYENDLPDTFK